MHGQIQTYRQSSKQGRRKQGECHFHGDPGGGQPFHNKFLVIQDCFCIFLIRGSSPAKCLNDFDSFYVFYNGTVHMCIRFIVLSETFSTDYHGKCHKYHGQWNGYKRSQCNSPVQCKQSDKADYRKQEMSASFRNHMGNGRFHIFDFFYHNALDFTNTVPFYIS